MAVKIILSKNLNSNQNFEFDHFICIFLIIFDMIKYHIYGYYNNNIKSSQGITIL